MICHKLRDLGITDKMGECLYDFLTVRSQAVIGNGAFQRTPIVGGTSQGTVLGPLLILVVLLDISSVIGSVALISYTDDTIVLKAV